jgi:hypothetical protein
VENEQALQNLVDPTFSQRITDMVQAQVAESLERLGIEAKVAGTLEGLDLDAMVRAEIEKALAKIDHKVSHARDCALRAREKAIKAEQKMARHQEKMRRAAAKMARRQDKALRERRSHHISIAADAAPYGTDPQPRVSQKEQLSILRMLQEGTITTEQADMLLDALAD